MSFQNLLLFSGPWFEARLANKNNNNSIPGKPGWKTTIFIHVFSYIGGVADPTLLALMFNLVNTE